MRNSDGHTFTKTVNTNDAWKFYAPASGKGKDADYFFHHIALRNLLEHYQAEREKEGKPRINRVILWSDGCGGQYMCSHSFVKVASFWKDHKVELVHRFAETSDFKGVHDTISKEDRRWSTRNVVADKICVPQAWDLYKAVRQGRPAPVFNWNQSVVTLARKPQLALDRYFYRFISWGGDDGNDGGDDVITADRNDKWGSTSVEGCMSHREYRSGSDHDAADLRMRCQPCSCNPCRTKEYEMCPFKSWVSAANWTHPDGWRRNPIMVEERPSERGASRALRKAQRRIIKDKLEEKKQRLEQLAPTIEEGNVVAFGVCESEREAQGVDFYLGKVSEAPKQAENQIRVGEDRTGWNIKKDEYYLVIDWYKEVAEGIFEEEGVSDKQLLEMVIELPEGMTGSLSLETLPTTTTARGRGRRRTTNRKKLYKLKPEHKALLLDQNYTQYVDRAAPGSSA